MWHRSTALIGSLADGAARENNVRYGPTPPTDLAHPERSSTWAGLLPVSVPSSPCRCDHHARIWDWSILCFPCRDGPHDNYGLYTLRSASMSLGDNPEYLAISARDCSLL